MGLVAFKLVLLLGLLALGYLFFFKVRSRWIHRACFTALAGFAALLVVAPDWSTRIASVFGIGRGVDFVLYLSQLLIFFALVVQHIRLQALQAQLTRLARDAARSGARAPGRG